MATYKFQTEKPLTEEQLSFVFNALANVPFTDTKNMSDCPEWVSEIEEVLE